MLVVVLRLVEAGVEMEVQAHRARPCPSERIDAEPEVGVEGQVVDLVAEEDILSLGVPVDIVPEAALDSGIKISGVPRDIVALARECGVECVVRQDPVSDADIQLGDYGVLGPGLETQEYTVLKPRHTHRIRRDGRVDIMGVVIESVGNAVVGVYGIVVPPPVGRVLRAVSDEGSSDVGVGPQCVLSVEESEGYAVLLVQEQGVLLHLAGRAVQEDVQLPGVHGRVSDAPEVHDTSVLRPAHAVVKVSGVGQIPLAEVVGGHLGVLVGRGLVVEDASASETVVHQGEVELRGDVLRSQEVKVVRLLLRTCEQGAGVRQLGVRGLGVVHLHVGGSVAPAFEGFVE